MLKIEIEREEDGRWIGEVLELPGVLAYGENESEARARVTVLALRVIADRIEHGESVPFDPRLLFAEAAGHEGRPCSSSVAPHRVDGQTAVRISSNPVPAGVARLRLRIS